MNFFSVRKSSSLGYLKKKRVFKWLLSPLDQNSPKTSLLARQKYRQLLRLKADKNRKRSVDFQLDFFQIDWSVFSNWTKTTHFETMMTTVDEVNSCQRAIHSTKISGNFVLKRKGSIRSSRKSFEKVGPLFKMNSFSRLDWSDRNGIVSFDYIDPISIPVPPCSVFSMCKMEEDTSHWSFYELLTADTLVLFEHTCTVTTGLWLLSKRSVCFGCQRLLKKIFFSGRERGVVVSWLSGQIKTSWRYRRFFVRKINKIRSDRKSLAC